MPADPFAVGNHSRLPQITPTGWAEEAWDAKMKLRQNKPMLVGPAGLPIPAPMAIYRPTVDKGLLPNLCRRAYRDHCDSVLPPEAHDAAAEAIARELRRLFPPADIEVLQRYRLTRLPSMVTLYLLTPRETILHSIQLDPPVPVPADQAIGFYVDLGGRQRCSVGPAPADLEIYGRTVAQLRGEKDLFDRPVGYVGQFKVRNGRWPKWLEIERDHPPLAGWMAGQRKSLRKDSPTHA